MLGKRGKSNRRSYLLQRKLSVLEEHGDRGILVYVGIQKNVRNKVYRIVITGINMTELSPEVFKIFPSRLSHADLYEINYLLIAVFGS